MTKKLFDVYALVCLKSYKVYEKRLKNTPKLLGIAKICH